MRKSVIIHFADVIDQLLTSDAEFISRLLIKQCMQRFIEFGWKIIKIWNFKPSSMTLSDERSADYWIWRYHRSVTHIECFFRVTKINKSMHANIHRILIRKYSEYKISNEKWLTILRWEKMWLWNLSYIRLVTQIRIWIYSSSIDDKIHAIFHLIW